MRHSFSLLPLLVLLFLLGCLFGFIQLGLITIAFYKLGVSTDIGIMLLVGSLLTSIANIPVLSVKAEAKPEFEKPSPRLLLHRVRGPFEGRTIIAVNVGGCVLPFCFCIYLFIVTTPPIVTTIICTAVVILVAYLLSRPIAGIGIGMPLLAAPVTAALMAISLGGEYRAAVAYIAGTLGVLIGADIMRLKDVNKLGTPLASIGGAGTFDGIFISGLLAVLLT